jgi:hypothetical protein
MEPLRVFSVFGPISPIRRTARDDPRQATRQDCNRAPSQRFRTLPYVSIGLIQKTASYGVYVRRMAIDVMASNAAFGTGSN